MHRRTVRQALDSALPPERKRPAERPAPARSLARDHRAPRVPAYRAGWASSASCGDDLPEPVDPGGGVDDALLTGERDAALWAAFGRLRPGDQPLLRVLTADPQPSYEEVSAALDMPVGSIGPTRARALERLRAELSRDGFERPAVV